MALATRCPNCHALFRVAADQLKLRGGLVRCGACMHAFDATGTLSYIDDTALASTGQAPTPAVGAVIAAIRKAESSAARSPPAHGPAPLPPASTSPPLPQQPMPSAEAPAPDDAHASAQRSPEPWPRADGAQSAVEATIAIDGEAAATEARQPAQRDRAGEPADAPEDRSEAAAGPADEASAAEPVEPAFLRRAGTRDSGRRAALLGIGALALATVLLAQLAVAFRADILARLPQARPVLTGLCQVFRCTVGWPERGDLLAVVGSELQALPGTDSFELTAVVRNRGNVTLALPWIELTLSDTLSRTVARKVFSPADYLAGEADPTRRELAGIEAGADLTVRIAFEARGLNAAGFVVYPFYL
jgi:predicted Zn finger-like uncharacterized protein